MGLLLCHKNQSVCIPNSKAKLSLAYPASRGFFLASLLVCTKFFASVVFGVVGLFYNTSLGEVHVNKPTTRNTTDANDFVHAKRLPRKKFLLEGYHLRSIFTCTSSSES